MERFDERELNAVAAVIRRGELSEFFRSWSGGIEVQAFEEEFARYLGTKNAVTVSNGTVALELALKSLGVRRGDEVIIPPLTFIATGTAVLSVGAKPVFVDIDPTTLGMDPYLIGEAITKKTKCIIPVSLLGFPVNMKALLEESRGIPVLEDAAQALGAAFDGKKIGTFGLMGTFSLQHTKTCTSLGEGGMIVTDDVGLADRCRNIRNHGNAYGSMTGGCVCTNSRMTEAQAAFGRMQLRKLDAFNLIQRENAQYFLEHIIPPLFNVYHPVVDSEYPTYMLIPARLRGSYSRDKLIEIAKRDGVHQGVPGQNIGYYKKLLYDYPILQKYRRVCHNAEDARNSLLLFDFHRFNHTIKDMDTYLKWLPNALEQARCNP